MTSSTDLPPGFAVTVRFAGGQAVVAVRGEVDVLTAPELRGILDGVAERHNRVVLDLEELDFMDASGLGIIARVVAVLAGSAGSLTIRSPTAMVQHLLVITGMMSLIRVDQRSAGSNPLAAQQILRVSSSSRAPAGAADAVPLQAVASIPANVDVVDGALRLVVALARATVGGADGVSVSLQRHGRLVTVAASDVTISEMDASQYATGEGPCVSASVEGLWFHAESLPHESRWPKFTPRAMELGINSILSSPLLVGERPVGALNIYSRTVAAFHPVDQELAAMFASEASTILRDAGVDVSEDQQFMRLRVALEQRRIIAQAEGIIMEREKIPADDAYRVLRSFARRSNRSFIERAQDVVASTIRPPVRDEFGPSEDLRG